MKNKTFLVFNHPEQIALCYIKDIDNEFIDCETIFCSDEEITLSFNDVLHKVSLKPEPNDEEKKNIKEVLYNKALIKANIPPQSPYRYRLPQRNAFLKYPRYEDILLT